MLCKIQGTPKKMNNPHIYSMYMCSVSGKPLVGYNIRRARENEFPFIAGITKRVEPVDLDRHTLCTASLISDKDILTAEHCLENQSADGFQIIVGSIDILSEPKYYPAWWVQYNQWAAAKNIINNFPTNDVCIIRLTRIVANGIPFGELSFVPYNNMIGRGVITMGWGIINNGSVPRILHTAQLEVIEKLHCEEKVFDLGGEYLTLDPNLICSIAIPLSLMISGDSGGPLLLQNKIVGVNSGSCPLPNVYFHPDKVNLHTNVNFYQEFISNILLTD